MKYTEIEKIGNFDEPIGWKKEPYTYLSDISTGESDSDSDSDSETETETETEILQEETDFMKKKNILPHNINKKKKNVRTFKKNIKRS